MIELLGGVARFQNDVFPQQQRIFEMLARHGQSPKTLIISCADSRVVPELITQSGPGEIFVCRNAGNIVPPFAMKNGGVSSAVEYAVMALGVSDIIVCGHSDCGAMKAFFNPEALEKMPNVKAWLGHAEPAHEVVRACYGHLGADEQVRAMALENVSVQLVHLQNHPSVAAGLARGQLRLHGWYFDIESGGVLAFDPAKGFVPVDPRGSLPVAVGPRMRAMPPSEAPVESPVESEVA